MLAQAPVVYPLGSKLRSQTDFTGSSPKKEGKVTKTQYRNKEMENTTDVKQIQQKQKEKAVAAQRLVPERLWWLLLRTSSFPLQWILHSLQTHCENGKEKKTGQLPSLLQGSYQSVRHHSTELPTTFVWQTSQASSWLKLLAPLLTERKAELLPSEPPLYFPEKTGDLQNHNKEANKELWLCSLSTAAKSPFWPKPLKLLLSWRRRLVSQTAPLRTQTSTICWG